jgi:hypothetical protein
MTTKKWHINHCFYCCLFNHGVPRSRDEAHWINKRGEVRLTKARGEKRSQHQTIGVASISRRREGVAHYLRGGASTRNNTPILNEMSTTNIRAGLIATQNKKSRKLWRMPAIPKIVTKHVAVEASGGKTIVHPSMRGR